MSRYRGPCFKKIRRRGALPGLTNRSPDDLSKKNKSDFKKKTNILFDYKKNKNCVFIMVLQNDNCLNTFVSPQRPKVQQVRFYYNYLKCAWITFFFRLDFKLKR